NLTWLNATGTNATTTAFFSTTASSTNLFAQSASIGTATLGNATSTTHNTTVLGIGGSNYFTSLTGAGLTNTSNALAFDFTRANTWTGLHTFASGFLSTASSTIQNLNITNSTTTNATTTSFAISNLTSGRVPYLTTGGSLRDNANLIFDGTTLTANTLSLSNALTVANGGTGATTFGQGWLFSSGGTGALSASTSPTVNYLVATSTSLASRFPYASSTAVTVTGTHYFAGSGIWNSSGDVGIGTTTPSVKLGVFGEALIESSQSTNVKISPNAYSYGAVYGVTAAGAATSLLLNPAGGNVGIGTTTPAETADIYSTGSLGGLLVEGNNNPSLSLRGVGGTGWYFGYVTATNGLVTGSAVNDAVIRGRNSGSFRISTDNGNTSGLLLTSANALTLAGTLTTSGLTSAGATNRLLCYNGTTSEVSFFAGTTCDVSSLRFKHDIATLSATTSLAQVLALRPVSFVYNQDIEPSDQTQKIGFIAEEVNLVEPRIVEYDKDGVTPLTLNYDKLTAILAGAIQEQQYQFDALIGSAGTSTSEAQSFAASFFANLFARITTWLADAGNGIEKLFAKEIHAENLYAQKLCLGQTCITESELQSLLQGQAAAAASGSGSGGGSGSATSTPDTESPVVTINGANPADIHVGDAYSDLGATVSDNVDLNLGIHTFVDGTEVQTVSLDTSTTSSYSITYRATDNAGNVGEANRVVNVTAP
ncbi:tail fiber domain-containing protein, partial [Candidatus Kaiserbacteria bacterium]|nr:tail fiber domain-containing protein [Candidatus Kaiserbacteria bacterium]